MSEKMLMEKLMALEFMAVDLGLFLDTHPYDRNAIETFVAISAEAKKAKKEYENLFGPLCMEEGVRNGKWNWIDEPWPWEKKANFDMRGAE